jgi:Ankyrin repeats (3 copies)
MTYSVHFGVTARNLVNWTRNHEATEKSSDLIAPPPLPPAPQPLMINGFRGMSSRIDGGRIELREVEGKEGQLTFELQVPGVQPHDPDHAQFYNAVGDYTMRRCEAVLYPDAEMRMQIEAPHESSGEEIGSALEAMDEVRTLVDFMQRIGGGLEHICAVLRDKDQTQTIIDLHSVFGGDPAEPSIQPEAVLRLANGFAAAGRPDLQLALLDVALPQCPTGSIKSILAKQWIDLATRATDEVKGPPLLLQQVVIAALLKDPALVVDPKSRSALERLVGGSVMRRSDREELNRSSLFEGSTGSRYEIDALSTLTPIKQGEGFGVDPIESRDSDAALSSLPSLSEKTKEQSASGEQAKIAQLREACRSDDFATVQQCIAIGVDINTKDQWGQTPLHYACRDGNDPRIVELLANHGADLESKDDADGGLPIGT